MKVIWLLAVAVLMASTFPAGGEDDRDARNFHRIVSHPTLTMPPSRQARMIILDWKENPRPWLVTSDVLGLPTGDTWQIELHDRTPDGETWRIRESVIGGKHGPFLCYALDGDTPALRIEKDPAKGSLWRIDWQEKGKRYVSIAEGKWKGYFLTFSEAEEKKELQIDGKAVVYSRRKAELTEKPGPGSALAFSPLSRQR